MEGLEIGATGEDVQGCVAGLIGNGEVGGAVV